LGLLDLIGGGQQPETLASEGAGQQPLGAGFSLASGAGVAGGTCSLAGERIVPWPDMLYLSAAFFLIAWSFA
jgi:hypothetical protein